MAFLRFAARCFLEKDLTSIFSSLFLGTAAFSVICSGDRARNKTIKVRDVQAGPAGCPIWVPHVGCGAIYIVRRAAERFLSADNFFLLLLQFCRLPCGLADESRERSLQTFQKSDHEVRGVELCDTEVDWAVEEANFILGSVLGHPGLHMDP